jgi:O-antigen ligase
MIRSIKKQTSCWWILPSLFVICLSLFIAYFSNTKNGIAIFAFTLAIFTVNLFFKTQWSWGRYVLATLIGAIIFSLSYSGIAKHIEKNSAWPSMIANFKVGLDIDHQKYWKNRNVYPRPVDQYGAPVDISTYERTAWFTAGIRLLAENPMGHGLLHHSFGVLALEKWPDFYKPNGKLKGATHSGWLDFALGLGIPGLLLVLIPLGISWCRSLQQQGLWFSYAAWTIPIMSLAYLTTEVAGKHFTEVLFFMTAFFCGLTLKSSK